MPGASQHDKSKLKLLKNQNNLRCQWQGKEGCTTILPPYECFNLQHIQRIFKLKEYFLYYQSEEDTVHSLSIVK